MTFGYTSLVPEGSSFGVASACFLVPILLAAVLRLASAHPHCHLQNGAYVTLASGADHIRQAAVLGYSLRRARTEYKMVVLVTEQLGVTEKSLLRLFYDEIVVVDKFPFEGALSNSTNSAAFLSKFRALQLVQYTRIVYLGADTITLKNIDELFCCTPPCGVYDMALWETTVYGTTINGDVLVLEPSEEAFERVLNVVLNVDPFAFEFADVPPCFFRMLQHCKQGYGSKTYIGPIDQAILNIVYATDFTVLPPIYNFMPYVMMRSSKPRAFLPMNDKVKILHYAVSKPWQLLPGEPDHMLASYWLTMRDELLAYLREHSSALDDMISSEASDAVPICTSS